MGETPRAIPLDKDLFAAPGGVYQAITSMHPRDRVVALHKYEPVGRTVAVGDSPAAPWVRRDSGVAYRRVIQAYDVQQATANVATNRFSRPSGVFRGVKMIEVPKDQVEEYWLPEDGAKRLVDSGGEDELERQCVDALRLLTDVTQVPLRSLGVTGSLLWRSHHAGSDLDVVVYGRQATFKFLEGVEALLAASSRVRPFSEERLVAVAETLRRKSGLPLGECVSYVRRKKFYLTFDGKFLSVAFVPTPAEVGLFPSYEDVSFVTLGPVTVRCVVENASFGYYYPSIVGVKDVRVVKWEGDLRGDFSGDVRRVFSMERELSSYVEEGEEIEVRGLLQRVEGPRDHYYQVYLGSAELFGSEYVRVLGPE
ncbi:MAG: nucleotidyltransferase [Promethearchaeota archaeon]